MSQFWQQVYPPRVKHVAREDKFFLGEDPDLLGFISLPRALAYAYHFHVHLLDDSFYFPNP